MPKTSIALAITVAACVGRWAYMLRVANPNSSAGRHHRRSRRRFGRPLSSLARNAATYSVRAGAPMAAM